MKVIINNFSKLSFQILTSLEKYANYNSQHSMDCDYFVMRLRCQLANAASRLYKFARYSIQNNSGAGITRGFFFRKSIYNCACSFLAINAESEV